MAGVGIEGLLLLFVFIWLAVAAFKCLAQCVKKQEERERAENERLRVLREQQQQARRRQQEARQGGGGGGTSGAAAAEPVVVVGAATTSVEPSAPPGDGDNARMRIVKGNLFFRQLEHADSIRTLSVVLAAANDRYDNDSEEGNVIAKTWRAAEGSVRRMMGGPSSHECCICLDGYEAGETVCWSKEDECDHIFHEDCICAWLVDNDDCPLCRAKLIHDDNNNAEESEEA